MKMIANPGHEVAVKHPHWHFPIVWVGDIIRLGLVVPKTSPLNRVARFRFHAHWFTK